MSIFSVIGNALTGPFRGVVNILKGDFKKGLAAFGDTAKVGAAFIPGIGVPAAVGIGAAGGGLSTLDDPNASVGNFLKGAAGGAATAGIGRIADILRAPGASVTGAGGKTMAQTISEAAPNVVMGGGGGGAGNWLTNTALPAVGEFVGKNPAVVGEAVSTGLEAYGAEQQRGAWEKQMEVENQQEEDRKRREQFALLMNAFMSAMPRY